MVDQFIDQEGERKRCAEFLRVDRTGAQHDQDDQLARPQHSTFTADPNHIKEREEVERITHHVVDHTSVVVQRCEACVDGGQQRRYRGRFSRSRETEGDLVSEPDVSKQEQEYGNPKG